MSARRGVSQWRLHVVLLGGLSLCALGFVVELRRGVGGHLPAWAYVFEWPLFGAIGLTMWWRLLHESKVEADAGTPISLPEPATAAIAPAE